MRVLNAIVRKRGKPQTIKTDNGSEFISKAMDRWAYERGIELDFSRPGKPTDNAMVESFNRRMRQECLNEHWFMSLDDAQANIEAWRDNYNESRPHSGLDWRTPNEFARQAGLGPVCHGGLIPYTLHLSRQHQQQLLAQPLGSHTPSRQNL